MWLKKRENQSKKQMLLRAEKDLNLLRSLRERGSQKRVKTDSDSTVSVQLLAHVNLNSNQNLRENYCDGATSIPILESIKLEDGITSRVNTDPESMKIPLFVIPKTSDHRVSIKQTENGLILNTNKPCTAYSISELMTGGLL